MKFAHTHTHRASNIPHTKCTTSVTIDSAINERCSYINFSSSFVARHFVLCNNWKQFEMKWNLKWIESCRRSERLKKTTPQNNSRKRRKGREGREGREGVKMNIVRGKQRNNWVHKLGKQNAYEIKKRAQILMSAAYRFERRKREKRPLEANEAISLRNTRISFASLFLRLLNNIHTLNTPRMCCTGIICIQSVWLKLQTQQLKANEMNWTVWK